MQRGLVGRVPAGIQAPIQAVQNQLRSTGTAQTTSLDILPRHDFNLDAAGIPGVGRCARDQLAVPKGDHANAVCGILFRIAIL